VRAFVTGATGFAGTYLCRAMLARGWQVRALARSAGKADDLRRAGAEVVTGDVRDASSLLRGMEGVDVVFHLAAIFREAGKSDAEYQAVNVEGTRNVVEAAARVRVSRFVHCSTVGVHGDTGLAAANESSPLIESEDSYNRTKVAGERLAKDAFSRLGLAGTIVRPSAGYGPGELRYLKLFRGIARGRFVMIGSGETWQNLAHIDDLCDGMILAGTRSEAIGETFILGGAENVTLADLTTRIARNVGGKPWRMKIPAWPVMSAATACELVCKPFGIEPPLHRRRVGFFTVNRAFDISKARRVLGYQPRVQLDDGLRNLAEWYRARGLL